jgi:hypothetical protein
LHPEIHIQMLIRHFCFSVVQELQVQHAIHWIHCIYLTIICVPKATLQCN